MNSEDINFKLNNFKFNYRVAAIFKNEKKYLIQKSQKDNYYTLIGGKVKLGEKTFDAVKREVKEEIGFEIKEDKSSLIRICENFFEYNQIKYHEILFI